MKVSAILFIAATLSGARGATAQQVCPWLTAGTAAAALGGPPVVQVRLVPATEQACTFTWKKGAEVSVLEIVVASAPQAGCPDGSPALRGIGNEATMCRLDRSPTETRYIVRSRVRSLYFRVSLTRRGSLQTAEIRDKQREQIEVVAEQVAGNLF